MTDTNETKALAVREQSAYPINLHEMSKAVADSGLFGRQSVQQIFTLMLIAESEGLHPMKAMRKFHVIEGKPTLRAEAILAEFQRNGGRVKWGKRTDDAVEAVFSHERGGEVMVCWDMEMARKAGLAGKDNWKKYPRQMLTARVISEGVRLVLPEIICGLCSTEEARDGDVLVFDHGASVPAKPLLSHAAIEAEPVDAIVTESDEMEQIARASQVVEDMEESAIGYLTAQKWLAPGETITDIKPQHAKAILSKPDKFRAAVEKWAAEQAEAARHMGDGNE